LSQPWHQCARRRVSAVLLAFLATAASGTAFAPAFATPALDAAFTGRFCAAFAALERDTTAPGRFSACHRRRGMRARQHARAQATLKTCGMCLCILHGCALTCSNLLCESKRVPIIIACVYIYIHIYMHVHMHMQNCTYACAHDRLYVHTCMHTSTHMYTWICNMHTHAHTCAHIYTHVLMHMYACTPCNAYSLASAARTTQRVRHWSLIQRWPMVRHNGFGSAATRPVLEQRVERNYIPAAM
jgi:hypothetical protein